MARHIKSRRQWRMRAVSKAGNKNRYTNEENLLCEIVPQERRRVLFARPRRMLPSYIWKTNESYRYLFSLNFFGSELHTKHEAKEASAVEGYSRI